MSFGDAMTARVGWQAEQRRARLASRIAAACDEVPGVSANVSGDEVELTGQGLLRRWLDDSRLRFPGRAR